jgi:TonB-linked SusC/RagA family outer membrane protein
MKKLLQSLFILLLVASSAMAQDRTVTGTVNSKDDGLPLPGVSVQVKGTKQGTQTGADGKFTISVPSGSTVLTFSFVGYASQNVTLGANSNITVALSLDTKQLGEVVVTALGFQAEKDKLGTSQSSVKGDALAKSGEVSVLNALSSKASGVQVVRSGGDPGAGTYIQIRGQSTITGNLQPLFIIDGVPVSNSTLGSGTDGTVQQSRLSDLNPNDIESMEVLKGAAAAALWGTRAANGVVVITTKKGKASAGKVNISFNSTYSVDQLNKSVPLQTAYGQGYNGLFTFNDRRSWGDKIANRAGGQDAFNTSGEYVIMPDGTRRYPLANGTVANPSGGKRSKQVYDHATELFRNGWYLDNTLALSGGDDKTLYYVSFSNLDQQGSLKAGSDYHRKSFKFNADRRFADNLKLSTSMGYTNVKSNRVQQGSNLSGIFLGGLRTAPDFDNSYYYGTYVDATGAQFPNRQVAYRNSIGKSTASVYDNPFWVINNITSTTNVNRLFGSFETKYDYKPWLSFIARAGADFYSDRRVDNFPTISSGFPGGSLTIQDVSELQVNGDFIAKVTKDISDDITFNGVVGFNYNNRTFDNVGATARDFILPDSPFDLGNSAASSRFPFNGNSLVRTTATYTQASFGLYDQLFVDLTARAERSSTFADVFYYPSASLGWQFTKLKSFDGSKLLSFGKLRASYGEVGVQPGPYGSVTYYGPAGIGESYGPALDASAATYGGGYLRSSVQGNPDLEPERKTEFELGSDLRFFSDKVSLSATYYENRTKGAIFSVQVPASTGYTSKNDNAAEIENKGVELDLGVNWLKKGDWSINTNATWSTNKNKVVSLKGVESYFLAGFTGSSSRAVEGQPLGVLWGVDFNRDSNGQLILDANGFPTAAPSESVIGDPNPDWIAGITNTIRYKKFGVSFLFDHVQGGDVWNGTRGALTTFGTHASTGYEVTAPSALKAFNGATIAAGTTFRGAIQDFGAGPVALNQAWYVDLGGGFGPVGKQFVEDGTRTRLREISLNYTLSGEKFRKATKLQSIDFSVTGRNLALWTDYTGIDPETNLTGPSNGRGLDYFNNPSTKSYFFTIKVNY